MTASQEQPAQAVRFSDDHQVIEPPPAANHVPQEGDSPEQGLSPQAEEEIRTISKSLQQGRCQARRMENFSFEPMSLPASRVRYSTVASTVQQSLTHYRLHRHHQHRVRRPDTQRSVAHMTLSVHLPQRRRGIRRR